VTDCGSAPVPLADRGGEHVGDEKADRLRLLTLVGACGALVAVLCNHAEIVLAHANRESPKSAALRSRKALILG
jgi:hypothetical protein